MARTRSRLLLQRRNRLRDGAAHARRGRGGATGRVHQRPEPRLDQALGLVDNQPSLRRPGEAACSGKFRRAPGAFPVSPYPPSTGWVSLPRQVAAALTCGMTRGRPLPERLREEYFLRIHGAPSCLRAPAVSGRAPRPVRRRLYEDPALGWAGLALGGVKTFAVPGAHEQPRLGDAAATRGVRARPAAGVPRRAVNRR
jgi:hypothetical protein